MADTNMAADQLKSFVRRIESVEYEISALNSDKSEIYKEAKSNGFDIKQLRKVIQKRRLPADERQEQDTVFDLYWDAVHGAETGSAHARVENIEEFPAKATLAALKADPAMAIVEPSNLKKKSEPQPLNPAVQAVTAHEPSARTSPVESEAAEISTQDPVANLEEEANGAIAVASDDATSREVDDAERQRIAASGVSGAGEGGSSILSTFPSPGKSVEAPASAAPRQLYAAPGVVTWEHAPPEGVKRHDYSQAFGDLGQDAAVIEDDLANAAAEPIVKIGPVILDGWARYIKSRSMVSLDGKPVEYPVVQYDGTDPLMDCIRWNIAGRILNDAQKRTIAQRLARLEPNRKEEIYTAFELGMELVA